MLYFSSAALSDIMRLSAIDLEQLRKAWLWSRKKKNLYRSKQISWLCLYTVQEQGKQLRHVDVSKHEKDNNQMENTVQRFLFCVVLFAPFHATSWN